MSRTQAESPSNFPHWVALGSLAFVLWLFFSNTVPAVRERASLRALDQELLGLRDNYDDAIQQARLGLGPEATYDLQALLLAIDAQGFTPAELCIAYPEPKAPASGSDAATHPDEWPQPAGTSGNRSSEEPR